MISVVAAVVWSNAVFSVARESSQPSQESNLSSQGSANGGDNDDIATNECEENKFSNIFNDIQYT